MAAGLMAVENMAAENMAAENMAAENMAAENMVLAQRGFAVLFSCSRQFYLGDTGWGMCFKSNGYARA